MSSNDQVIQFLLIGNKVTFRKLFRRNLLFIWENADIIESSEDHSPVTGMDLTGFAVVFLDAANSGINNVAWLEQCAENAQCPPVIVLTDDKDEEYAKSLLRAGAKAMLAKTELTKKKILNAVNQVMVTPESTIEFDGDVYADDENKKPALPGYQVHEKSGDNPVSWIVSKREINSSCEAFIFQQFSKPDLADKVRQQFSILTAFRHTNFIHVLGADLLPGNIGKVFLVQKKHEIGLREISPGCFSAKQLLQHMLSVLEGLDALHEQGFICGYLHPKYFFLDKSDKLVLSLAPMLAFNDKRQSRYASPERRRGEVVDKRSDYYSLAAVFHYFITGKEPDANLYLDYNSEYKLIEKIIEGALIGVKEKRYSSAKEFQRFVSIKCAELLD